MQVMNYYKMTPEELEIKIKQIRDFLFNYPKDERVVMADFALSVALNAEELKRDPFVDLIIEYLT